MTSPSNHHATVVVIGDRGVMIRGESGSGKTTLALTLLAWSRSAGCFSVLVSDDQVLVTVQSGRIVCAAPDTIAGLVEVRGRQPTRVRHETPAVLDLVVNLVDQADAPRFDDDSVTMIEGCSLPLITVARHNTDGAFAALASWHGLPPFDHKQVFEHRNAAKWLKD